MSEPKPASVSSRRRFQKNSFWLLLILLTIAAAVVLGIVSDLLEERFRLRWDLTRDRVYSIGAQTEEVLGGLDRDIIIYTVYPQDQQDMTISELLRRYESASELITVKNIDPVRTPYFTQQFAEEGDAVADGSIIVADASDSSNYRVIDPKDLYEWQLEGDRLYATGVAAEQRITAAVQSVMSGSQMNVYFAEGHGEMDMAELYYLQGTLASDGYNVESYHLIYNDTALKAGDCLVFMAPLYDLSQQEYQVLAGFLKSGGKAIFMVNPLAQELPLFESLLSDYGLLPQLDMVVESSPDNYLQSPVAVRPRIYSHPATEMLIQSGTQTIMPRARSIQALTQDGMETTVLYETSVESYGKVNPYTETLEREEGDTDGPFALAVAVENKTTDTKLVLFGSTDFISSLDNAKYGGNLLAFVNSVSWATGKEAAVAIQPKSLVSPPLSLNSVTQTYLLIALVVLALPAGVLAAGAAVWRQRKRR